MTPPATHGKRSSPDQDEGTALKPDKELAERLGSIASSEIEAQAASGKGGTEKPRGRGGPTQKKSGTRKEKAFTVKSRRAGAEATAPIKQNLSLGDGIVNRIFEQRFDYASSNMYFLVSYARALINSREPHLEADWPQDKVEERARDLGLDETLASKGVDGLIKLIEASIDRHIELLAEDLRTTLSGLKAKLKEYEVVDDPYDSTTDYEVKITSPQAMKYMQLFRLCDQVALATNRAWIHGIINTEAKDSGFYTHVKLPLNDAAHLARDLYVYIQRRWSDVVREIPGANDHDNKKKIVRGKTAAEKAEQADKA